jgi:hypothetical protein
MSTARTNIRNGVKSVLKNIVAGVDSGYGYLYKNTIADNNIGIPPRTVEQMREFPFINIYFDEEICENTNRGNCLQTGGNRQLWHNQVVLVLDCWITGDDSETIKDDILGDILAVFGNNYTINGTVFECAYSGSVPFGVDSNRPSGGITVKIKLWYDIYQTNPSTLG